jgi:hypothetical protein
MEESQSPDELAALEEPLPQGFENHGLITPSVGLCASYRLEDSRLVATPNGYCPGGAIPRQWAGHGRWLDGFKALKILLSDVLLDYS